MTTEYLKGEPSPSNRYTLEYTFQEKVAHLGRYSSCEECVARSQDEINRMQGCVVAYESLPEDHPFRMPDHPYHIDFGGYFE